ncbi:hypothetical protein PoB_003850000 [Plakobranchus ocellatus]|uniref:Uncharacterized protein n=1 Tax=Plakobranchus ocellatus TaxID=259542 RepID=A0AAV4AUH5_9GAST|nr:hypothetical protein PoB_003850000 [Plakobranchus ocellatus]
MDPISTSTDQDDHPYIFHSVNGILWLAMIVFVAFPFAFVSSLLLLVLRPLVIITDGRDVADLSDFVELCQYMPEMCIDHLMNGRDFIKCVGGRRPPSFNFGTPV